MEGPARVPWQPYWDFGLFVCGVVVQDDVAGNVGEHSARAVGQALLRERWRHFAASCRSRRFTELGSKCHKIPGAKNCYVQLCSRKLVCLVSVVEELNGKLAELGARLEEVKAESLVLEPQKAAFATVIEVFDPSATSEARHRPRRKDRSTPDRRVTDRLRGRDVRRGSVRLKKRHEVRTSTRTTGVIELPTTEGEPNEFAQIIDWKAAGCRER